MSPTPACSESRKEIAALKLQFIRELSDPAARRFAFEATVFKSKTCQGFVGYGDADPSNVSALVPVRLVGFPASHKPPRRVAVSFFVFPHSVEAAGT